MGQPWHLPLSDKATISMAWITPGTFAMGSPASGPLAKPDEWPQTRVALSRGFWLGRTMVTIGQWKSAMGLDVRGQLTKMLRDDTLYDLGGKKQTVRDYMRFSRGADPGAYLAGEDENPLR